MIDTALRVACVIDVYLQVRPLLPGARPAVVVRRDNATLAVVDPTTTRRQAVDWFVKHMTCTEQNGYRAAYGQPPVGQPLSDWWMDDAPVPTLVPPALRLDCDDVRADYQQEAG